MTLNLRGIWGSIGVVALAVALFGAVTVMAQDQDTPPRTQYEALDLGSPEATVQTFVDRFQARDYPTVFLIFAPQTQMGWSRRIALFQLDRLVSPAIAGDLVAHIEYAFNHTQGEHGPELVNYMFDDFMLFAEERDGFLIDLRGAVEILRSVDNTISSYDRDDQTPLPVVDVITSVDGIDGEVVFRTVPTPSGRWQVMQVIVPGGDEALLPWSVIPDGE